MKHIIACLLTILFALYLHAGNDTQKKVDQIKSKAVEAYTKDQKGKSLEEIADEEAKKQQKSSKKSVKKTDSKKPIVIEGHPSRLELWKKQREQQSNQ